MQLFRDKFLTEMPEASILDIGSRETSRKIKHTYRELFPPPFSYLGMDIYPGRNVDVVGYEELEGKQFDVVISGQVLEHVNHPWEWLKSLTPYFTKYICIIAPHTWREHKNAKHGVPPDTYRALPDGMKDLLIYAGFKIVDVIKSRVDTMGIGTKWM